MTPILLLPITREAFEVILKDACDLAQVDVNDDSRICMVNYLHGLDRYETTFDLSQLANYLRKAYSHKMTFEMSQEIDKKRRVEQASLGVAEIKPDLSVVPPTPPISS
jgi:hypothetical protein